MICLRSREQLFQLVNLITGLDESHFWFTKIPFPEHVHPVDGVRDNAITVTVEVDADLFLIQKKEKRRDLTYLVHMYGFSPLVIVWMSPLLFISTHISHDFSAFTYVRKKTCARVPFPTSCALAHVFLSLSPKRPHWPELTCCLLRPLRVIMALSFPNMRVRQLVCIVIRLERRARDE